MEGNLSQPEPEAQEMPAQNEMNEKDDDSKLGMILVIGSITFVILLVLLMMNDLLNLMFSFDGLFAWILVLWLIWGVKLIFFLANHFLFRITFPRFIASKVKMPIWWILFIIVSVLVGVNIYAKVIPFETDGENLAPVEVTQSGGPFLNLEILNLPDVVSDTCTLYDLEIRASNVGDETLTFADVESGVYSFNISIPSLYLTNTIRDDSAAYVEDFGEIESGETKTVRFKAQVAVTGFDGEPTTLYNPFASWQQTIDPITLQVRAMFDEEGDPVVMRSESEFQTLEVDSWIVYDDPDFGTTYDGVRNCEPEILSE